MLRNRYVDFIQSTHPDCYNVQHNTDVPRAVANVSWICFGGAPILPDVSHRSAYSMLPQLHSLTPDVVYIHLGENDLAALTGPALLAAIRAFVNAVIDSCHPRVIVVSQLTLFLQNNHLANRLSETTN